ncbi:hypothetical protein ACIBG4_04600 [Nonomuraea sp. NPDC050383]|uniref:hypothetical protein n=1 Tax=Nonomuraea sp. NPDC050383 TaxID=3364362 RepID=UPI0037A1B438
MAHDHDVQALSDVDVHVYEAVAAQAQDGGRVDVDALCRTTGLEEESVRRSLAALVAQGYVVPQGDGVGLGPHTFGVDR